MSPRVKRPQTELLKEMLDTPIEAIIVKVNPLTADSAPTPTRTTLPRRAPRAPA